MGQKQAELTGNIAMNLSLMVDQVEQLEMQIQMLQATSNSIQGENGALKARIAELESSAAAPVPMHEPEPDPVPAG